MSIDDCFKCPTCINGLSHLEGAPCIECALSKEDYTKWVELIERNREYYDDEE